jgi:hypothetical protein
MKTKLISEYGRLHDINNDIVDRLKSDKKSCKYFFEMYLKKHKRKSFKVRKQIDPGIRNTNI